MTEPARFLVLEGCDGVGKSTQLRLLTRWFEELGVPFVQSREPGGTGVGEAVREVVLEGKELSMPAVTELFLMLAARAAYVKEFVAPSLEGGRWVISDRFDLSTFAYQGRGRGIDARTIAQVNDVAVDGVRPDLYLVFDMEWEELEARRRASGSEEDRIEEDGDALHRAVHAEYRRLIDRPDVEPIDASGTPEEVHRRVCDVLRERYPETFGS